MRIAPFVLATLAGCGFQTNPGAGDAGTTGSGSGSSNPDASTTDDGRAIDGPVPFDPGSPIAGGGVGGGAVSGTLAVYVIETYTNAPLANATVEFVTLASADPVKLTTDAHGLATFTNVVGAKQTVGATLANYRSALWVGVGGAHVTLSLLKTGSGPATGTLSATSGDVTVPKPMPAHSRSVHGIAVSATDDILLGGISGLVPSSQGNQQCTGAKTCTIDNLTVRAGKVAVAMDVVDNGNAFANYQFALDVDITAGNTTAATLTASAPTDLVDATVDYGTVPTGLGPAFALVGFQTTGDGTILYGNTTSTLAPPKLPKLTAAFATAKYRALAGAYSGTPGTSSFAVMTGTDPAFKLDAWLSPPTQLSATAHLVSYAPPATAQIMVVLAGGLQLVVLDGTTTSVAFPADFAESAGATLYALHATPAVDAANFGFAADGAKFDALSTVTDADAAN